MEERQQVRPSGRLLWGWWPGASDDEPEHERDLTNHGGLGVRVDLAEILRQQDTGKADDDPGEAGEGQPSAKEARDESRPVDEQRERKEPQPPEDFGEEEPVVMEIEEEHGQRFALGAGNGGKEIGATRQREDSDGVELIHEGDGDRDHNQNDHEHGLAAVDRFQQVI